MEKLELYKKWIMLSVAVLLTMIASYLGDIKNITLNIYHYAIVASLSLSAAKIAELLSAKAFKIRCIRKLIMGSKYVEGHWLLKTHCGENDPGSPILNIGIMCIDYDDETKEVSVKTTRISEDLQEYWTASAVAHIRTSAPHLDYLNFFRLSGPNQPLTSGYSHGIFPRTSFLQNKPHWFTAEVSIKDEPITRTQFAYRIPDSVAKLYQKKYGESWMKIYISAVQNIARSVTNEDLDDEIARLMVSESTNLKKHIDFIRIEFSTRNSVCGKDQSISNPLQY